MADIDTPRLRLAAFTASMVQALIAGDRTAAERELDARLPADYPDDRERLRWLPLQLRRLKQLPERADWMARFLVEREQRLVIGHAGFHGPPEMSGRAEIGYTVFEPHRRRGYATEACRALTEWAFGQGEPAVFLSIRPDNVPSLAVARGLGYVEVGTQDDPEDGLELVFERRVEVKA